MAVASWKQSRRRRRTAKGRRRGKGTMAALQGRSLADRSGRRPGERRPAGKQFQILIYLGEANYYFKHNKTPVIHTSTLRTIVHLCTKKKRPLLPSTAAGLKCRGGAGSSVVQRDRGLFSCAITLELGTTIIVPAMCDTGSEERNN